MVRMPSLINLGVAAVLGTIVGSMKLLNRDRSAHRSRPWVASLLTLIFLPTLYVTWFGGKSPKAAAAGEHG